MLIKWLFGYLSIRVCTCKYVEKISKNHVFICNMHGDYVVKYAILSYNQWSTRRVCDGSVNGFCWNLCEENESSSLFKEMKMKTSYVKVRKKTVEWESERIRKRLCTNELEKKWWKIWKVWWSILKK